MLLSSLQFSSVQSLSCVWLFGTPWMQHARLPCPSPAPGACWNSWPSSRWCIQPSHPLSSPSPPVSGSVPMSQYFTWGGQCIGVSSSALPVNIQDWFSLGLTGWISLQSKGLSRVFSRNTIRKHQFFGIRCYDPTLTFMYVYWKNHSFDYTDLCSQRMFLLFNMLSRLVIAFLPMNKCLLISWLHSPSAVILDT